MLKSKIHRATVTDANVEYMGSITLSHELLSASGIKEFEKVHVVNLNNGARIETYTIVSQHQGVVCLNGAAARHFQKGDLIIIMAYSWCPEGQIANPKVVFVDGQNHIVSQGIYVSGGEVAKTPKVVPYPFLNPSPVPPPITPPQE
jgi:aspartate 1-decarboxylase